MFIAYLLSLVLNMLSNLKTWPCNTMLVLNVFRGKAMCTTAHWKEKSFAQVLAGVTQATADACCKS